MPDGVLLGVRERPLLLLGEGCRLISVSSAGMVESRIGGGGVDVISGVRRAGGDGGALLLVSPCLGSVLAGCRSPSVSAFVSKSEFECLKNAMSSPLQPLKPLGRVQDEEIRGILEANAAVSRGSHVHLAGAAVGILTGSPAAQLPSVSASLGCEELRRMSDVVEAGRLPRLLFVGCECGGSHCSNIGDTPSGRLIVRDQGAQGVEVVVDGIVTVRFRAADVQGAPNQVDVLAGSALVGVRAGMPLEEAVANGVSLRQDFSSVPRPDRVVRFATTEDRSSRVVELMEGLSDAAKTKRAVALLVFRDGQLLMGRKPDDKAFVSGRWYLPGGKVEGTETFVEAAQRELREETGLEAAEVRICGFSSYVSSDDEFYCFVQFICDGVGEAVAADDLSSVAWVDPRGVGRPDVFDLTWAQLCLLREEGRLP